MENPEILEIGVSPRPAPATHTSTAAALGLVRGARRWLCFLESIHCYFQKHKQMQMSLQTLHNEMQGEDSLSKSLNSPSKQV